MHHFSIPITDSILSGNLHHVEKEINIYTVGNGGGHKVIQITSNNNLSRLEIEQQIRGFLNIYDGGIIYKL